jgi:hypothetical protein
VNFRIFFAVNVSQFSSLSLSSLAFSAGDINVVFGLEEGSAGKGASLTEGIETRNLPVCGETYECVFGSSARGAELDGDGASMIEGG